MVELGWTWDQVQSTPTHVLALVYAYLEMRAEKQNLGS